MSVCSHCIRSLRRQAQTELFSQSTRPLRHLTRPLSTSIPLLQQAQSQQQQEPPAPIPTTTPTITSNVTAPAPPQGEAADYEAQKAASEPVNITNPKPADVSRMQSAITSEIATSSSLTGRLARKLRDSKIGGITDSYAIYGLTEQLFQNCAQQADYNIPEDQRAGIYTGKGPPKNADQEDVGVRANEAIDADGLNFWFDTLGLEPTFSTWSQVTYLHMYILTVQLRTLPTHKEVLDYQRYLSEHFSHTAEDKMGLLHGMIARGIRNRYLKEMFIQWRGALFAYDEGLVKGDAVLAGAIWRNLWKAKEDVDWEKVAKVVAFVRKAVNLMDDVDITKNYIGNSFWESCRSGAVKRPSTTPAVE